jgi:hypothetical protein
MLVYRVSQGRHTRWFIDEGNAREHARIRYDIEADGIPFVTELDHRELIVRLNELEARSAGENNSAS